MTFGFFSVSVQPSERRMQPMMINFTDVSERAGIQGLADFGGHAAAVADLNGDGWEEICVTNCGNRRRDETYLAQPNDEAET